MLESSIRILATLAVLSPLAATSPPQETDPGFCIGCTGAGGGSDDDIQSVGSAYVGIQVVGSISNGGCVSQDISEPGQ